MKWQKVSQVTRHIEIIIGLYLLSRLVWVMFLVGIQLKDTQQVMDNLLTIMKALAEKLRVRL
ncbi:MAG: hypothetical protein ACFFAU_00980 [Candidatus Hodarchaeota archaeon]